MILKRHLTGDVLDCKSGVALRFPPQSKMSPTQWRNDEIAQRLGLRRQSASGDGALERARRVENSTRVVRAKAVSRFPCHRSPKMAGDGWPASKPARVRVRLSRWQEVLWDNRTVIRVLDCAGRAPAATALSSGQGAWKFQPAWCVRKRCRASLATEVQKGCAFHDSHPFLIAAFSAAFFSAKEGSSSAIWVANQASSRIKIRFTFIIKSVSSSAVVATYL